MEAQHRMACGRLQRVVRGAVPVHQGLVRRPGACVTVGARQLSRSLHGVQERAVQRLEPMLPGCVTIGRGHRSAAREGLRGELEADARPAPVTTNIVTRASSARVYRLRTSSDRPRPSPQMARSNWRSTRWPERASGGKDAATASSVWVYV